MPAPARSPHTSGSSDPRRAALARRGLSSHRLEPSGCSARRAQARPGLPATAEESLDLPTPTADQRPRRAPSSQPRSAERPAASSAFQPARRPATSPAGSRLSPAAPLAALSGTGRTCLSGRLLWWLSGRLSQSRRRPLLGTLRLQPLLTNPRQRGPAVARGQPARDAALRTTAGVAAARRVELRESGDRLARALRLRGHPARGGLWPSNQRSWRWA